MTNLFQSPVFTCALYAAARVLLAPLSVVPGAVPLDPLWVLLAMGKDTRARLKVPTLLPGLVLGDLFAGLPWTVIAFRAMGLVCLAWIKPGGGFHHRYFFFMTQHALWSAVMSDWTGDYPLGYLYVVWLIQGLMWWGVTAPVQGGESPRPLTPILGTPAALLLLCLLFPAPPPWPIPDLGTVSGTAVRVGALILLLLPPAAALVIHAGERKRAPAESRWSDLVE